MFNFPGNRIIIYCPICQSDEEETVLHLRAVEDVGLDQIQPLATK